MHVACLRAVHEQQHACTHRRHSDADSVAEAWKRGCRPRELSCEQRRCTMLPFYHDSVTDNMQVAFLLAPLMAVHLAFRADARVLRYQHCVTIAASRTLCCSRVRC
jgi:hypothetical protein